MILKRHSLNKRALRAVLPLAGLGAAAALSGCGGATTNVGGAAAPTRDSGPAIYGNDADALSTGSLTQGETSGLSFTPSASGSAPFGVLTGAFAYKTVTGAGPLPVYQKAFPNGTPSNGVTSSPGVPLGFSPGGTYFNSSAPVEALPTNSAGTLIFGTYISTGVVNAHPVDLNQTSVVVTSSDAPTFSLPLTFDPNYETYVLPQLAYKTAPFAIPAFMQTSGLHDLHTTVSDLASQTSTTDFVVATVAPTDVALFFQSFDTGTVDSNKNEVFNAITPGDTVTVDGGAGIGVYPAGYTPTIADAAGTVALFTTPGTHTLTETNAKGTVQTSTFTLSASTAGTTGFSVPPPGATITAAALRSHVPHSIVKRAVKR